MSNTSIPIRVISLVICLFFFALYCGPALTVHAVLTELVIGGVVVASVALAASVVIIGMQGSDLGDAVNSAASSAGKSVKTWMVDNITAYANSTGVLPLDIANFICQNVMFKPDGTLRFEKSLGDFMATFGEWMGENAGLDIPVSPGDSFSASSDLELGISQPINFTDSVTISSGTLNNVFSSASIFVVRLSNSSSGSNRLSLILASSSNTCLLNGSSFRLRSSYTYNGKVVHYYIYPWESTYDIISSFYSTNLVLSDMSSLESDAIAWTMVYGNIGSTGASNGLDVWNNEDATDGFVVDPTGLLDGIGEIADGAVANVGDYIDTLADVIAGVGDIALPVAGVGDIPVAIPADLTIPVTPAIPAEVAGDVPIVGENTGDSAAPYSGTGDYTLPLADFFPFCIPFDLYKMLSLLSAAPVAPAFTWNFYVPGGGTIPIEIDLSDFDTVASVLRTIETLAFCVGLGFATKKLLFGS